MCERVLCSHMCMCMNECVDVQVCKCVCDCAHVRIGVRGVVSVRMHVKG